MDYEYQMRLIGESYLSKLQRKLKKFFIIAVHMYTLGVFAQNSTAPKAINENLMNIDRTISYGEKINFGTIDNSVQWTILNKSQNISVSINGNEINKYVFDKPGIYEIHFSENRKHTEECIHPAFNEKMLIEVTAVKMNFDFSHITFSEKIKSGVNYNNLIITVPVNVIVKDNKRTNFKVQEFSVAGVGSELKATPLQNEMILTTGKHSMKYKVSGIVKNETYLMFDFIDFNNNVQTYNQPEIVN